MSEALVKEFYTKNAGMEWQRLVQDAYHRVELDTTLHFLEKYLPARGLVLDAGGGPGRYTIELARRGYDVVLLDLAPANLAFARERIAEAGVGERVAGTLEGSLGDLSQFASDSFDAVACLGGPLSHVLAAERRQQAVRELIRVARPGAHLFISVIGRLSLLAEFARRFPEELEMPHFAPIRDTGDYAGGRGFTACHFYLADDLVAALRREGVEIQALVGLEGLGARHEEAVNALAEDPARWAIWWETHLQTCTHPAVVDLSEHILLIGRK